MHIKLAKSRKGYCKDCKQLRDVYLYDDIEEGKQAHKCYFCDSSHIKLKKRKWKAYGNHKKKKYDYKDIRVITSSSKNITTKKVRTYPKEAPKQKRKFRKVKKHKSKKK